MPTRGTSNTDDETLEKAPQLTGVREKTALVPPRPKARIDQGSSKRLAGLGGTQGALQRPRRRRPGTH